MRTGPSRPYGSRPHSREKASPFIRVASLPWQWVVHIILNGTFTLANENYVVVYFRCSLGLNPLVQAG